MSRYNHTFAILAYKESPYLEECIASLKNQTVPSRIVMTTSTPSSFLDRMSKRHDVPLIINEKTEGIASDWSFAYNACTTKYVTLAHQDDVYAPEYAAQCLAAAGRHADNLIVFTDSSELADKRTRRHSANLLVKKAILSLFYLGRNRILRSFSKRRMLSFGNPISCPSVMFHREKIGQFEFARDLSYNLDWDAWHRLSQRKGSFVYVKKDLVSHRIHGDSALVMGTADASRTREDQMLFRQLWPAPIAALMARLYILLSYQSHVKG